MADVGVKGLAVLKLFIQCGWIGLSLTFPPEIQGKLAKYRQNWEILNGNLPVLKTDMHLQSGEVLHHVQQVNWLEERTETRRVNYSGYTYNTKVIGNLKWKAGTITPHKITQEVWKCIDSGYLFLAVSIILLQLIVQQLVMTLMLLQEMSTHLFYSTILN